MQDQQWRKKKIIYVSRHLVRLFQRRLEINITSVVIVMIKPLHFEKQNRREVHQDVTIQFLFVHVRVHCYRLLIAFEAAEDSQTGDKQRQLLPVSGRKPPTISSTAGEVIIRQQTDRLEVSVHVGK